MAARRIMYIGNKPSKKDNVNNNELRVWRGIGDVRDVDNKLEAAKLMLHPEIWVDITDKDDEEVAELLGARREYYRERERSSLKKHIAGVLNSVSEDELRAELELRGRMKNLKAAPQNSVLKVNHDAVNPERQIAQVQAGNRPSETTRIFDDISKAIFEVMDDERNVDDEGQPILAAVQARVGYPITDDDLAVVWKHINEPKTPPEAKTAGKGKGKAA